MEPRIVEQAPMAPGQCQFSQDIDGPWIDTGVLAPWIRPYGYLSVAYVEGLAKNLLGMRSAEEVDTEHDELRDAMAALSAELEQVKATAEALGRVEQLKEGAEN